jgi:hypothetical protein
MRRVITTLTILILGLSFAVQDNGTKKIITPRQGSGLSTEFSTADLTIPKSINFQGYLYQDGTPVNTTMDMRFGIWTADVGGSELYSQTKTNVVVTNGWFSVILDNITNSIFPVSGPTRYLEVKAPATGPALTPRISLVSVGYSYHAITADSAEYAKAAPMSRPITPPINGIEIAKPCTLQASVAWPGAVLRVRNSDPNGAGIRIPRAGWYGVLVDTVVDYAFWADNSWTGLGINRATSNGAWIQRAGMNGIQIDSAGSNGIYINQAGQDGLRIMQSNNNGLYVDYSGNCGVRIDSTNPSWTGMYIRTTGNNGYAVDHSGYDGLWMLNTGHNGVSIYDSVGNDGFFINRARNNGTNISSAGNNGVYVDYAYNNGVHIMQGGNNGVYVDSASDDGYEVRQANYGLYVQNATWDGVLVSNAKYGIYVTDADYYGVYANSNDEQGGYFRNDNNLYYALTAYNATGTGATVKGLYVHGNGYATGGWSTFLADGKAGFSLTSSDMDIVARGSSSLTDGQAMITFEKTIQEAFSNDVPLTVIVTPTSECNGILVVNKSATGFTAKELLSGKSNATFDWIAIGRIKGYEQRPEIRPPTAEELRRIEERNQKAEMEKLQQESKQAATKMEKPETEYPRNPSGEKR